MKWLIARCPRVRFVWIMGADNLRSFHRWQKWRGIAKLMSFVVIDRLGLSLYAAASPAGQAFARARIAEPEAASPYPAPQTAGLGVSAWPQIKFVLDGAAGHAPAQAEPPARRKKTSKSEE